MAATVQLLNSVPDVVLCGNKVPLRFEASDNYIVSAGSKASVVLTWTAVALADEYFDLLLFGETIRFTCKSAPDNSGIQFHDNTLGETLANWVTLLASDLQKNYLISRYYTLIVAGAAITIEAKETGSDYSQEFTAGVGIDCTANESNKTGTDKTYEDFYGVVVHLYCNGVFEEELILNVDADGIAETDIAELLKPHIEQEFSWPESNADFIFARTGAIMSWYFRYGERWGDNEYTALQESSVYYAIHGGVSWMQQAKYNTDLSSYWAKLCYNKYFLSWAPLIRYIGREEPVKLYFLNHSAATTLTVRAKLYTATSNTTITVDSVTGVADKTIWEVILSPAKVNYTGLSAGSLVKIEVWIEDQASVRVSEIRTFIFDYTDYEFTRYFIFKNSLGAFEVLRSTGLMQRSEDYIRETASVNIDLDYTSKDREEISIQNQGQQRFIVSLGWLSRYAESAEFRSWLRDFTLSREVYMVNGATLTPVRLTGNNFVSGKDRDNIREFGFEFVNSFLDESFTKELTWNLVDESFNSDFELAQ